MLAKTAAPIHEAAAEAAAIAEAGVQVSLQRRNLHAVQRQDLGRDQFLLIHGHRQRDVLHQGNWGPIILSYEVNFPSFLQSKKKNHGKNMPIT
jgi:hypothetical protein